MNLKASFEKLGPGLLYAGAAVGVSHLVNSTKAGALYGSILLVAVLVANIIKYPFFEMGPRYAAATGESLLEGYKRLGNWAFWLVVLMTISTMFIIQAAVTVVTAGLAQKLLGIKMHFVTWSAILLAICTFVLGFGRYQILDRLMKIIMIVLTITTIVALASALGGNFAKQPHFMNSFSFSNSKDLLFIAVLIGWMPAPFDISIWHSIWSLAKSKVNNENITLSKNQTSIEENFSHLEKKVHASLFDFKVGYWGTAILACFFLLLGSLVLYGSGTTLSPKGGQFANQLIDIYTSSIGSWAYWIILVAAFTTMFSTTITVLDGATRLMSRATSLQLKKPVDDVGLQRKFNLFWMLIIVAGSLILLGGFIKNMGQMIKIATVISFITAPIIALLNYLVINKDNVPKFARPSTLMNRFSIFGIALFSIFSIGFLLLYL